MVGSLAAPSACWQAKWGSMLAFDVLVGTHIVTGSVGLLAVWVPIVGKKGRPRHRWWGNLFVLSMLLTGTVAVGISTLSILYPLETHPHMTDEALVRGIFGWMMLYLAILTVNLAWYGWLAVHNMRRYAEPLLAQSHTAGPAAGRRHQLPHPRAADRAGADDRDLHGRLRNGDHQCERDIPADPAPMAWLIEHFKGLVGAGISVYTAFFAFGAVRLMPEMALSPVLWAVPLVTGLAIILYHRREVARKVRPNRDAANEPLGETRS